MSNPYPQYKGITFYSGVGNTQQSSGNVYGDGTVYRGERSKDSEVQTMDMTAHEYKTLWYAAAKDIERIAEERDAIVSDADKAYALLRWAETEMRYAGWGTRINDQHGRTDVYEAIKEFLK